MIAELEELKRCRETVNAGLARYALCREQCRVERAAAAHCAEHGAALATALGVAQTVAVEIQELAHKKIATIVTRSLAIVFDDSPYEFKILFEQKRGRTEAELVFEREGLRVEPLAAAGGGVVDVAAFALRLSCLLLSRPPLRRVLVLDEPFKMLSRDRVGRVRELLEILTKELGVQIILVTHDTALACGKTVAL